MDRIDKNSLLHVANLSIPSVIVINGNFTCGYCRLRVSQIISKITGLKEYTVDVQNKRVIARGDIKVYTTSHHFHKKRKKKIKLYNKHLLIGFFLRTAWKCN